MHFKNCGSVITKYEKKVRNLQHLIMMDERYIIKRTEVMNKRKQRLKDLQILGK
jgi:hypothetical protein